MRLKTLFLIVTIFYATTSFCQKNTTDSLKEFTIKIIQRAIKKSKIKKISVWDFTDMNKEITTFGSHIAELISVYATNVDSIIVMDRQNLKALLREHKLKSEGFIDQNTIMELGRFSDVDAVVVGDAIVTDRDFEVIIKVLETNKAGTIAADDQFFPIDNKMASKLGIKINESTVVSNTPSTTNRGFNRPINSNEQYNNSETVNKQCEKSNIGDYCFYNAATQPILIEIHYLIPNPDSRPDNPYRNYPRTTDSELQLNPGESKCIYNVYAGEKCHFIAYIRKNSITGYGTVTEVYDKGDFIAEKCKSKTYSIK